MKKIITLTETELIGVVNRIAEEINLSDYEREDFIDVFFQSFRSWISKELGEEFSKYPMSWLLKRYGQKFVEEKELIHRGSRDTFDTSSYSLEHYGRELVKRAHYTLPSLYKNEKFTDKYKKVIPQFIEMLNLPSFVTLELIEDRVNNVNVIYHINFEEWMKYPEEYKLNTWNIFNNFKKLFENFAGVEFGNPAHGEVLMTHNSSWKDEVPQKWIKTDLNKVVKKAIRGIEDSKILHSIRFGASENGGRIELVFKNDWGIGYDRKSEFTKKVEDVVKSLGYGPNLDVRRV